MTIHHLLHQRAALLQQVRLANVAYAFTRLGVFARRAARGGLRGAVGVRPADLAADRPWAELTALEGAPAVLEEHFLEPELAELAEVLAFVREGAGGGDFTFRWEELEQRHRPALRRELARAGIAVAEAPPAPGAPARDDRARREEG